MALRFSGQAGREGSHRSHSRSTFSLRCYSRSEKGRVERIPYELCVLSALRDALRRREIWAVGARKWRIPEEDLPAEFEENRDVHYGALGQPLDPTSFVEGLKGRLSAALSAFDDALAEGTAGGVRIITRRGEPWISVPKLGKLEEPENLSALKGEVRKRWGTVDPYLATNPGVFVTFGAA